MSLYINSSTYPQRLFNKRSLAGFPYSNESNDPVPRDNVPPCLRKPQDSDVGGLVLNEGNFPLTKCTKSGS